MNDEELKRYINEINFKIDKILECLYGDGDPRNSMTDRLSIVEHDVKMIKRIGIFISAIFSTLLGLRKYLPF